MVWIGWARIWLVSVVVLPNVVLALVLALALAFGLALVLVGFDFLSYRLREDVGNGDWVL